MELDWLAILLRWLHITGALLLGGGILFWCCALRKPADELATESGEAFRQGVRSKFSKLVMLAALMLLASGLINFIINNRTLNPQIKTLYHALFGIKFLLALAVIFLASVLAGRSAAFDKMRANSKFWLGLTATLVLAIVLISNVMRTARDRYPGAAPAVPVAPGDVEAA